MYTRLTPHAYAAWEEVEAESGLELVVRCGGLHLVEPGGAGGEVLDDYAVALREVGIPFELLDAAEIRRRHPQWRVDEGTVGLYQRDGGILDIGRATAAHLALARARGATVLPHTEVLGIADGADGVEVRTSRGTLLAEHLVVCAGAWTPRLLADALGVHLPVALTREQVTYFATPHVRDFLPDRFGVWSWHGTDVLYGFPIHGLVATKAAIDMGGPFVNGPRTTWSPTPTAWPACSPSSSAISRAPRARPSAAGSACTTCPRTATSCSTRCPATRACTWPSARATRRSSPACSGACWPSECSPGPRACPRTPSAWTARRSSTRRTPRTTACAAPAPPRPRSVSKKFLSVRAG